jgi:hypothetical protein
VKTDDGGRRYELAPWMPGVIEFSIARRMDDAKAIQRFLKLNEAVEKEATGTSPAKKKPSQNIPV